MTGERRTRAEDGVIQHLLDAVGKIASGLAGHVASCTTLQEHVRDQLDTQARGMTAIQTKLDRILLARAGEAGERRGGARTRAFVWSAVCTIALFAGWCLEHFGLVGRAARAVGL